MKGDLRTQGWTRLWMDAGSVERGFTAPPCPSGLHREDGGTRGGGGRDER